MKKTNIKTLVTLQALTNLLLAKAHFQIQLKETEHYFAGGFIADISIVLSSSNK